MTDGSASRPIKMTPSAALNVLVFPGGTEIGLEIASALRECKDVQLFSAGSDVSNHAPFVFAHHFHIPAITDSQWVARLNAVVAEHSISYVFPAHDDVIVSLAQNAANIGCGIVSSPQETCMITRSKSQTYRHLSGSVPVPRQFENPGAVDRFPVFVKPDRGQGSRNTHLAADREHLEGILRDNPGGIIVEYLSGAEFTVDCFSDRDQGLLFCSGRQRIRTRSGISMNSRVLKDEAFGRYAAAIAGRLRLHGAWFFQLKRDAIGQYKLLEIGPRVAGTMALHRVMGVNFPLLSLYEQQRRPIRILTNPVEVEIDRALVNRYRHNLKFDTAYIDLDDTLILKDRVNVKVVAFIYQCFNKGVRVVLLTRHAGDVDETLRRYRLTGLFDQVIHVPRGACKSDFIREQNTILVDDSFSERAAAVERHGIPTFDCSMLEMLADERA